MSSKSLNYLSDEANQKTNKTGVTTPILTVEPEDGTLIRLLNQVSTGDGGGLPIFADLRDSNDNPLPTSTDMVLRVKRPTDDEPVAISVKEDNIATYNQLTISEQRNTDNIDSVKHELKGGAVNVRDKDTLRFEIDSSTAIDWSNSELYVYRQGVQELAFQG
jgi:hypothetical protein